MNRKTLGETIRHLRQAKGLSQEELAAKVGVSRQAVSKWEQNLSRPDTANLLLLAELFGVSADDLAGIQREMRQEVCNTNVQPEEIPNAEPSPPQAAKSTIPKWLLVAAIIVVAVIALAFAGLLTLLAINVAGRAAIRNNIIEYPNEPLPGEVASVVEPYPDMDEFSLLWQGDGEMESLTVGTQKGIFPFNTDLVLSQQTQVTETDFSALTLHTAICGDLHLRYLHLEEEGSVTETVTKLSTIVPGYETPRLIGVGSDEDELLEAYGDVLVYMLKESGEHVLCPHDYCYAYAAESTGGRAILFYIADGHVAGISVLAGDDAGYEPYRVDHTYVFPIRGGEPDFSQRTEPEQEAVDATRAVYISLYALQHDANLSTEDVYRHRQSIYQNLAALDWSVYGSLGEAGQEDQTAEALLRWLEKQDTLSKDEMQGLLAGACRSNLDSWMTDWYTIAMANAFIAYPVDYISAMLDPMFSNADRNLIINLTGYGSDVPEDLHEQALAAAMTVEQDPLRYSAEEAPWAEAMLARIRQGQP